MITLDHPGLCVADLDAAVAFYGDVFGFETEFPFRLPVDDIRGVMLRLPDGGRLELFERPGSAPGRTPATPIEALTVRGYGHFAVSAADIEPLYEAALAAGGSDRVSPAAIAGAGCPVRLSGGPGRQPRRARGALLMGRLDGKVCFITGTAGGQGAAAAELFEAEGAVVVGTDIQTDGVDLADPDQARAWIDDGVASAGRIDVLYNNASATRVGRFEDVTFDDWSFTIRNELDLIFTATVAAWPHFIRQGTGHVINTASVSAHRGALFQEQAAHGAAKGGVLSFTRHLAASGSRHGIRANAISPGLTRTPQIAHLLEDPAHPMHALAAANPLGRMAEPEDIARVALFLASDDAAYVNAAELVVDGGESVIG